MVAAVFPSFAPPPSVSPSAHHHHKLRTFVVLNAKSSRGRLASFEDAGSSTASSSPASSASSSPAASPQRTVGKSLLIPDECLAYESYAAVASRFHTASSPTRDLRWSDISRPTLVPTLARPLSQKARRREMRRTRSASSSSLSSSNDHVALELCFEFLALPDLERAAGVCTEFRDVIKGSGRLLLALYAREWRGRLATPAPMARAYATVAFAPALTMLQQRRRDGAALALATRSQVTARADATVEILNNSLLRVLTRGAVDSARGVTPLPVLSCARALGKHVSYFEVAMSGCGSVGLASLSDPETRRAYGYGSDEHVGWKGVSCGYHGNDGDFVFNNGAAPYGGEWTPYGPSWGVRNDKDDRATAQDESAWPTVGCGLDLATRRVFFTLNGTFLGFATFAVPDGEYAAAVSLHEFNDRAVVNGGSAPFRFDIEGFCASL